MLVTDHIGDKFGMLVTIFGPILLVTREKNRFKYDIRKTGTLRAGLTVLVGYFSPIESF